MSRRTSYELSTLSTEDVTKYLFPRLPSASQLDISVQVLSVIGDFAYLCAVEKHNYPT